MRASVFKARCLKVMNEVPATGEPVVVTKRGKPVVKVIPASFRIYGRADGDCRRHRIAGRAVEAMKDPDEMILPDARVLVRLAGDPGQLSRGRH